MAMGISPTVYWHYRYVISADYQMHTVGYEAVFPCMQRGITVEPPHKRPPLCKGHFLAWAYSPCIRGTKIWHGMTHKFMFLQIFSQYSATFDSKKQQLLLQKRVQQLKLCVWYQDGYYKTHYIEYFY